MKMAARLSADSMFPFVILMAWISYVKGQGCPGTASPVVRMCTSDFASGSRIFLDTYKVPPEGNNCTCILRTTSQQISVSLLSAPRFQGCQSRLEFMSSNPITFECMISGINIDVSLKKEFEVNFRKTIASGNDNYCADIRASPSSAGTITTVSLECRAQSMQPTSSTTTTTTTQTMTSTFGTTTTEYPTSEYSSSTPRDHTTSPGEITTEDFSYTTTDMATTTSYTGNTGFPNSVSQTAIIIICVIVGAGLLVGIIIAVAAILGKRNRPSRNVNKHRFSAPKNGNFELAADNGTSNGNTGTRGHKDRVVDDKHAYDDKLHRNRGLMDIKGPMSHTVYDNKAYFDNETPHLGDNVVVSERL